MTEALVMVVPIDKDPIATGATGICIWLDDMALSGGLDARMLAGRMICVTSIGMANLVPNKGSWSM